ncbi:MAG: energy transducer TonB [Sphingomonas sp.]|jgi:hypothetical protein
MVRVGIAVAAALIVSICAAGSAQMADTPWVNPLPKGTSTIPNSEGRFVACIPPTPAPADFNGRCAAFLEHKKLARVAIPKGQSNWLKASDFRSTPHPALGVTTVSVKIDSDGHVSDCLATTVGDFAVLDAQVCALVKGKARFSPAHDDNGAPTPSSFAYPFNWK